MSATAVQTWVAILGSIATAIIGILTFFNYRTKRARFAIVGAAFNDTVESLAGDNPTKQLAAAVLLRRFLDPHTEQGTAKAPYRAETIEVIAGMLKEPRPEILQKALADGLRYAHTLTGADLQHCQLKNAYLGAKAGDKYVDSGREHLETHERERPPLRTHRPRSRTRRVEEPRLDMSGADLYGADLTYASLRKVVAVGAAFYEATLVKTVFEEAILVDADFRGATLTGAKFVGATLTGTKFAGANISGARFEHAIDIPEAVLRVLGSDFAAPDETIVPSDEPAT